MQAHALSLDQLQERLGELLVALLLDAQLTSPLAGEKTESSTLLAEFGRLIEAMLQIENDTTQPPGAYADTANALGNTAYQLLELATLQLQPADVTSTELINELQTGFADWVTRQRGTPILDSCRDATSLTMLLRQTATQPTLQAASHTHIHPPFSVQPPRTLH